VEDEDVDTEIKNGHDENNRSLKKKTQKSSKYEYVMFLFYMNIKLLMPKLL
jgi:hypothetical protein